MANEDICIRFGRKLRKLRHQKGWTQSYMAVHTGLGRPHISNLETGKKEAGLRALEILALSFGMSLPKLLSRI
ncbi:MAG: helix-turn-helix domain-containing protein [Terriglobales bacterium]